VSRGADGAVFGERRVIDFSDPAHGVHDTAEDLGTHRSTVARVRHDEQVLAGDVPGVAGVLVLGPARHVVVAGGLAVHVELLGAGQLAADLLGA